MNVKTITRFLLSIVSLSGILLVADSLQLHDKFEKKCSEVNTLKVRLERGQNISKMKSEVLKDVLLDNAELRTQLGSDALQFNRTHWIEKYENLSQIWEGEE